VEGNFQTGEIRSFRAGGHKRRTTPAHGGYFMGDLPGLTGGSKAERVTGTKDKDHIFAQRVPARLKCANSLSG